MRHAGRILVVTDDPHTRDFVTAVVELAGYDVDACAGPGATLDCPRLHGSRCFLRERARVAIVDLDCDEEVLACSKVPDDGGTVYLRRSATHPVHREALLRAIEDAQQHVEHLHGSPTERAVRAVDLD